MKVMVFGGSGFVGGHLARRLARDGHEVTVATRYAPAARHLSVVPGVRIRQFSPFDSQSLDRELPGHDAVVNLIGILNERGFGGHGFRRVHVELVESLAEAAHRQGIRRFLHMSALNAGNGSSFYLQTRGEGEELVRQAQNYGQLDTTMFRPSTIFGPDDSFLNRFAGLLKISPVLPLARPGAFFSPVFVGDVVEAMARVLADESSYGKTYELCGTETWSLKELVIWVRDQLGLKRLVIGLPDWAGRLQGRVFDFVPGKPFSSDNFNSLTVDSVCMQDGFGELGIEPWGMSQLAPDWLGQGGKQVRYQDFRRRAGRNRPGAGAAD